MKNSVKMEICANLSHNDCITYFSDTYSEEELWLYIDGNNVYKDEVQDFFNDRYDYYLTEIDKVVGEDKLPPQMG